MEYGKGITAIWIGTGVGKVEGSIMTLVDER